MDLEQELKSIGLTQSETKTYLALIELGESQTGSLCDKVNIPSSHIYRILKSLMDKGIVSYKILNNTKLFRANPPEALQSLFDAKQQELEETKIRITTVIHALNKLPKEEKTVSDYKYFQGLNAIRSMWREVEENFDQKKELLLLSSTATSFSVLNAFYLDLHKSRVQRKVKERMIIPKESAKKFMEERIKMGLIEIRSLPITNKAEFAVYGDLVLLLYTAKTSTQPRAFLIKDKIFSDTFVQIFENLWKQAKPNRN